MKKYILSRSNISSATLLTIIFSFFDCTSKVEAQNEQSDGELVELPSFTITAQKRKQELVDVPINITVGDQQFIDDYMLDDIEDFADFVPGLNVQVQSAHFPSYSIRGITSDDGNPRVAIFQNGVSIGNPSYGSNFSIFDMERIEVLKGPQPSLFGQGALVGGINFIQKKASLDEDNRYFDLELGSDAYLKTEAMANIPINETAAIRFAGQIKNREGYVESFDSNMEDFMGYDSSSLRFGYLYKPSDDFEVDLLINYQEDESTGTQFKSGTIKPDGSLFGPNEQLNPYTATSMNINADQQRDQLGFDRELASITFTGSYSLTESWTINSITDFRGADNFEAYDSDGSQYNILQFGVDQNADAFNQEIRFNYDNTDRVRGFVGYNYSKVNDYQKALFSTDEAHLQAVSATTLATNFGTTVANVEGVLALSGVADAANFDNLVNPLRMSAAALLADPANPQIVPLHTSHLESRIFENERKTHDIFADFSYELTDRLTISAGIRYSNTTLDSSVLGSLERGNPNLGGARNGVTLQTTSPFIFDHNGTPSTEQFKSDNIYTGRLIASYKVRENLNAWLSYSRGNRPAVFTPNQSGRGFDLATEEYLDSYEIGTAGYFDQIFLSSSLYYGEYEDFQVTRTTASGNLTENTGEATQYGFEIEGRGPFSKFLDIFSSYSYNLSRFDKDGSASTQDYSGNRFRLSPRNTYTAGAIFKYALPKDNLLFITPSYSWKSQHFFEDDNNPLLSEDGYGIVDINIALISINKGWKLKGFVENLLDEEYLVDAGNTGYSVGIPTFIRGTPQRWGAGFSYSF